ncbi:sigma-70 family RNA polymerase sigma factor [Lacunimicrobium album]
MSELSDKAGEQNIMDDATGVPHDKHRGKQAPLASRRRHSAQVAGLTNDSGDEDQILNQAIEQRHEFDQLLQKHRGKIMLYLMALVQNVADAEDLCQRISVVMWQKFQEFDRSKSFLSWACGVARFEAFNHRRSRSHDRLTFQTDLAQMLATSVESLDQEALELRTAALLECVRSLPAREQSFLQRIYWEGCSFESIAKDLGCTSRTFYNRMYLLRRRLSECVSRRLKAEQ